MARTPSRFAHAALSLALGVASLTGCASNKPRALHMVERSGEHAYKLGDYSTAVSEWREVVDRRPGRWDARVWLAKSYLALGEPKAAREQLEVAYTIKPLDNDVLELLATAMLESEDFKAMSSELRQRAEDEGTVSAWMRYGTFLQKAGDFDSAETALLTAARIDKGQRLEPQMALANLYRDAGDQRRAVARLKNALWVSPGNERIMEALRSYGEVPGPTVAVVPPEYAD